MADIFKSYPPSHDSVGSASRGGPGPTHDGGKPSVKPIPYSAPKGPTQQMRNGPGLGGTNHGQCGTQRKG